MSRKSSTIKDDKPVNISISFNIAPNEIIKTQKDKRSPGDIRGRKIRNHQTLKSNRDTPLHYYQFRNDDLTERETFSRDEPRIEDFKKKRNIKRQSMDGIFEQKPIQDKLFISCENNKIFEKPQIPQVKLTPMMSTRRKCIKPKTARPSCAPTSTKSENLRSGKIETSILKSVLDSTDKEKVSIKNLKHLISKLVADELKKHQDSAKSKPATARPTKTQKKIGERKKSHEMTKRSQVRKRPQSKTSTRDEVIKLNSLKLINDSSLIKSESDREPQNATAPIIGLSHIAASIKTSASNANLREMVRVKYPEEQLVREYTSVQQQMAIKIQRFWRQFKTKKLVKQYVAFLKLSEQYEYMDLAENPPQQQSDLLANGSNIPRSRPQPGQFLDQQPQDVSEIIEQFTQVKETKIAQYSPKSPQPQSDTKNMKQFHSFQLGKQEQSSNALEFKRRQISKWDQTLDFIAKNMNSSDVRSILLQVAQQLETNKTLLQKQLSGEKKSRKDPQRNDLASFTVALTKQAASQQLDELQKQINQLAHSYVSQQPNQQLNDINFKSLHAALNNRKKALELKQAKELQMLEDKLQLGKITKEIYEKQRERLARWMKYQQAEIKKAKQHLDKGLNKAKHIIEKNTGDKEFFKKLADGGMKRCLSDSSFRQFRSRPKPKERQQVEYEQQEEEESDEQHSLKRTSEQLFTKKLKEKLDNLNNLNDKNSPDISYQELSREYNEQDDDFISNQQIDDQANIIKNQLKLISEQHNSSLQHKLENLQDTDREDIFEFIFLDMCIQFCQQVVEDSRTSLVSDFFTKAKKPPVRKSKGIKTNITIVKEYLKRFISFLTRTNLKIMDRVGIPMGPSALEMLKYMHYSEDDVEDQEQDLVGTLVLPTNTFEAFENTLLAGIEFEPYYDDPKRENDRIQFLKGVIHIHNKAIFDSLNESLDLQRPFGIWGKPFPWKRVPEFCHTLTHEQIQAKFKQSTDRVVQNCTYVCGIIIDKQDSLVAPGTRLSEDYIEQIKQDRLSRMLASDLIENEERWVFYDDEETEVLVEISHLIYQIVLRQGCKQVLNLVASG